MASSDIGIDLGTRNSLVYTMARGIILKEPSVAVYDKMAERIRAIGGDALSMVDHLTVREQVIWPIRQGVITDYIVLEKLLQNFIARAMGKHAFRKPRISICVPASITEIGRKALEETAYQAGARKVYLVESPIVSALGAGIDLTKPSGNLIVDIGAGTTDVAVLSMMGVVLSTSVKVGGDSFNQAIMSHVRHEHSLFIGEETAELIKRKIGTACEEATIRKMEVRGRNMNTGLPKLATLTSEEVRVAMHDPLNQILEAVHSVLEKTPPELAVDIVDRGIVITGGGGLLHGMDKLLEERTGVSTLTAQGALVAAVVGTGKYAQAIETRNA